MTKLRTAALLLLALGVGLPALVRADDEKKEDKPAKEDKKDDKKDDGKEAKKDEKLGECEYMPLAVGTTWTYDAGHQKLKIRVTEHEKVKDVLCARLETESANGTQTEHLSVQEDGVYRHTYGGIRIEPPICVLKLPYKKGSSWKVKSKQGGQTISGKCSTDEDDDVDVPAGTFKTIVVKGEFEAAGQTFTSALFLAKGKGMVRQEIVFDGQTITVELRKFKLGTGKVEDDDDDKEEKKPEGKKPEGKKPEKKEETPKKGDF